MLDTDTVYVICSTLSLAKLMSIKRVSKTWAIACRRTIQSESWQSKETNRLDLKIAPPRFRVYGSAEEAFACFRAAPKVSKLLLRKRCKQMAAIHGARLGATAGDRVAFDFFRNQKCTKGIFDKGIKVFQHMDGGKIYIVSDVYGWNVNRLTTFVDRCVASGMYVVPFELDYPLQRNEGGHFYPPKTVGMVASGYDYFYRGKMAGLVL